MNGDKRSPTSGQRADDALLANEKHVGRGKRQIDNRYLYRQILEIPNKQFRNDSISEVFSTARLLEYRNVRRVSQNEKNITQ